MSDQFFGQPLNIHRLLTQLCQLCQRRSTILRFQCIRNAEQIAAVGNACHAAHHIGIDLRRDAGTSVQNGQCIAQSAVRQTGNQLCTVRGQLQMLFPRNILHSAGNVLGADTGKVIPLAAGQDRSRNFLDLGGGQNKDDMGRRLFQRFQQSVERRCRQHVHLIDDINLIFTGTWRVRRLVAQVADVIHAVVGCRIHLHHIEDAAVVDAPADLALTAGVTALRMQAVDRLGKNFGTGGLARAAHAGKQVSVTHAVCSDLVFQRGNDGTLTNHVLKTLRPPLAV